MAEGSVMLTWEFRDLPGVTSKGKGGKDEKPSSGAGGGGNPDGPKIMMII